MQSLEKGPSFPDRGNLLTGDRQSPGLKPF
jgi:hypothetical protein